MSIISAFKNHFLKSRVIGLSCNEFYKKKSFLEAKNTAYNNDFYFIIIKIK